MTTIISATRAMHPPFDSEAFYVVVAFVAGG